MGAGESEEMTLWCADAQHDCSNPRGTCVNSAANPAKNRSLIDFQISAKFLRNRC